MSKKNKNYNVGYGKPPKEHQFKKGQSGNQKGRSKGSLSATESLHKILSEKVETNINGEYKKITYLEVIMQSLVNGSVKLNHHALKIIVPQLFQIDANNKEKYEQSILKAEEKTQVDASREVGDILKKIGEEKGKDAHKMQKLEQENIKLKKKLSEKI